MIRVRLEDTPEEYKQEALELWRASGRSAAKVAAELGIHSLTTTERHGILPTVPLNFLSPCCRGKRMKIPTVVLAALLLGLPVLGTCQSSTLSAEVAAPATPAAVKGILAARRFTLGTPFAYTWTKEHIMVSSGTLVVLEVDSALVVPRDTLEPVLYAGNVPVMRLNHGHKSGRVVGIIPGNVDLATTPIWFGAPQLPGRVTTAMADAERARAEKAGALRTFGRAPIVGLDQSTAASEDLAALLRTVAADLVLTYSPQEKDLVDSWRLPVAKASPTKRPH
jgi:hypothetical protein